MTKRFNLISIWFNWIKMGDQFLVVPTLISTASVLFILLNYILLFSILPEKLPLFYSRPWGESQLVDKWQFLILPASLLLINLINLTLASQLHPSQALLRKTLMLSTLLVCFLILVSSLKILLIFI